MTSSFYLGSGVINTLAVSTAEVTRPFLLPEMVERLAGMLNYFLLYLAGPQRKMLKVRCAKVAARGVVVNLKLCTCKAHSPVVAFKDESS